MSNNTHDTNTGTSPADQGSQQSSGTGAHARNRVEAERDQQDRQALGTEGQKKSGDKPDQGRKGR